MAFRFSRGDILYKSASMKSGAFDATDILLLREYFGSCLSAVNCLFLRTLRCSPGSTPSSATGLKVRAAGCTSGNRSWEAVHGREFLESTVDLGATPAALYLAQLCARCCILVQGKLFLNSCATAMVTCGDCNPCVAPLSGMH